MFNLFNTILTQQKNSSYQETIFKPKTVSLPIIQSNQEGQNPP